MNIKETIAQEALKYIKDGMTIGLGGGGTIAYLAQLVAKHQLDVRIVTPSFETEQLCVELGLILQPLRMTKHVDIAFDGCDEVDLQFHALKSGGGIHTREKLIANMAEDYMLLVPAEKCSAQLRYDCPIVLELLEDSFAYVQERIIELGATFTPRSASGKYGPLMSDHGNVLADVRFPKVTDCVALNQELKAIAGVIDTSLLTNEVTQILIANEDGFQLLKKKEEK